MEAFMFLLDFSDEAVEIVNENLALGDLVTVVKGPLKGLEGELCSFNGENKIIVRIESLGCAMVNIPSTYVESLTIHTP
jgi:ribosomal protein L24